MHTNTRMLARMMNEDVSRVGLGIYPNIQL